MCVTRRTLVSVSSVLDYVYKCRLCPFSVVYWHSHVVRSWKSPSHDARFARSKVCAQVPDSVPHAMIVQPRRPAVNMLTGGWRSIVYRALIVWVWWGSLQRNWASDSAKIGCLWDLMICVTAFVLCRHLPPHLDHGPECLLNFSCYVVICLLILKHCKEVLSMSNLQLCVVTYSSVEHCK